MVAVVKANREEAETGSGTSDPNSGEHAPAHGGEGELDVSLLEDSLAKTPWERMQANDALVFAETLRAAMEKRNAKPQCRLANAGCWTWRHWSVPKRR